MRRETSACYVHRVQTGQPKQAHVLTFVRGWKSGGRVWILSIEWMRSSRIGQIWGGGARVGGFGEGWGVGAMRAMRVCAACGDHPSVCACAGERTRQNLVSKCPHLRLCCVRSAPLCACLWPWLRAQEGRSSLHAQAPQAAACTRRGPLRRATTCCTWMHGRTSALPAPTGGSQNQSTPRPDPVHPMPPEPRPDLVHCRQVELQRVHCCDEVLHRLGHGDGLGVVLPEGPRSHASRMCANVANVRACHMHVHMSHVRCRDSNGAPCCSCMKCAGCATYYMCSA